MLSCCCVPFAQSSLNNDALRSALVSHPPQGNMGMCIASSIFHFANRLLRAGELAIKSSSRLANLLPRPSVQWLQRACAELAAIHSDEGSGVKQCGVCKRMVFNYLLLSGQHKMQCIPADAPPSTGEDPRRRKARTASRQPSPVSPRPSARHVSPPSKRQKPAAVRPAQPTAKASHLNASFTNRKLPQEAAAALPRSPPPPPVAHPSTLSKKAAQFRRRRMHRSPRTKPFSFVPFDPSDFTPAGQGPGTEPDAAKEEPCSVGAAEPQSNSKPRSVRGVGQRSHEMRPASSATSQPVSPGAQNAMKRHLPDVQPSQAADAGANEPYMPQQKHKHPGVSAASQPGYMQPSVAPHNAAQWAQHSQQQVQQLPVMPTHPLYTNTGAGSSHVRMGHGESSRCSQQHMQVHSRLHSPQQPQRQPQVPNHVQAGVHPTQQATQRKNPLPISHAELGKLFQNYLRSKNISRNEFSQEHREAFKQMVLRLSAQRSPASNVAEQQQHQHQRTQHPQQQQHQQQARSQVPQHHLQHQQPQQQLQYAVAMNHQSALGRGVQMHLQHAQGSMVPAGVEQSPTHSLHALSGGRTGLDSGMHAGPHMHGGMQMHMSAAGRGMPSAGNYMGGSLGNVTAASHLSSPHTQQLASPHAGHASVAHGVSAAGHMHLQQQAMYPLGMQGHLLGHGDAMNRMGGLAVQSHHHDARCDSSISLGVQ